VWTDSSALWSWAADEATGTGTDQLVIIVGGILVAAVTAAGTVLVAVVNARANKTAPSPPAPAAGLMPAPGEMREVHEDVAVLRYRADDSDERDELQDRRLDQIERHLDLDNPNWRHDGR